MFPNSSSLADGLYLPCHASEWRGSWKGAEVSIELGPELEQKLREAAAKRGLAVSDYVRPVLEALVSSAVPSERSEVESAPSYLHRFLQAAASLPDEVVQRLPTDGARNLDTYLYGAPRREEEAM